MEKVKVLAPFHDSLRGEFVAVGDQLEVSASRAADLERNGLVKVVKAAPKADAPKTTSKPAAKK